MARELSKTDSPQINSPQTAARPSHDEIAQRAYEIFLQRGCPEGRDMDHWLEAETQLMASRQQASAPPAAKISRETRMQPNARR